MNQLVIDAKIVDGVLTVRDLPLENTDVKVVITPKVRLEDLSFLETQEILGGIKRDIADDIINEREQR